MSAWLATALPSPPGGPHEFEGLFPSRLLPSGAPRARLGPVHRHGPVVLRRPLPGRAGPAGRPAGRGPRRRRAPARGGPAQGRLTRTRPLGRRRVPSNAVISVLEGLAGGP